MGQLVMVKQASIIAYYADIPALYEGDPGTGKTAHGLQFAENYEVPSEVIIGSLSDPTDVGGHPVLVEGEEGKYVTRAPDEQFYRLAQWGPPEDQPWRKAIAGLDEINWSPPAVQATMLRFAHERKVGTLDMHGRVWPWGALNPGISGAYELIPSLANRFLHLPWTVTTEEWVEGMVNDWPFPEVPYPGMGVETAFQAKKAILLSFLKARPDLRQADLTKLEEVQASGAWPSGRTWEMAIRLLATAESCGVNGTIGHLLVGGCVGTAAGDEFLNYLTQMDLPDPEDVLADPENYALPTRGDKAYAAIQSVVAATLNNPARDRKIACWAFLASCAKQNRGPAAAAHARELAAISEDVLEEVTPFLAPFTPLMEAAGLMDEEVAAS